jgi:hypothetical protein
MTKQEELERRIAMLRFTIIGGRVNGEISSSETEDLQKELSRLDEELNQTINRAKRINYSR